MSQAPDRGFFYDQAVPSIILYSCLTYEHYYRLAKDFSDLFPVEPATQLAALTSIVAGQRQRKIVLVFKIYIMNTVIKFIRVVPVLLLFIGSGYAQGSDIGRPSDAILVEMDGYRRVESPLRQVVILFSANSGQLNMKLNIPHYLARYAPPGDNWFATPGLSLDLRMAIDLWQVQDYLTSVKMLTARGTLTLNNVSKPVKVEYIPLLAGTEQDGNFNLSLIIRFSGSDFNLDLPHSGSQFIIRISDLRVNRV